MTTEFDGNTRNGCRLVGVWNSPWTATNTTITRTVTLDVYLETDQPVTDTTNAATWSGAFGSGSDSTAVSLSYYTGRKLVRSFSKTVTLTGSTQTISHSHSLTGIEYADGTLTLSTSQTMPKRPAPAAPSGVTVTRNADGSHTVYWTNNGTASSDQRSVVQRVTDGGSWTTVSPSTLGVVTSWKDTTTAGSASNDRRYQYRVASKNPAATSAYATQSGYSYGIPDAPTNVTAKKNPDGTITVTWNDNSSYESGFEVQDSPDGTTWTNVTTTVAANATSYNDPTPLTGTSTRYRVRAKTANGLFSAWSSASLPVVLLAAPNAATGLLPSSIAQDATRTITATWNHNPVDTTDQTAYELRLVDAGGAQLSTTGKVASAAEAHTWASDTHTNGTSPRWQVRTWGGFTDPSPWSVVATFDARAVPVASWIAPTDAETITGRTYAAQIGYADESARPQSSATVRLYDASGTVVEKTWTFSGAVTTFTLGDFEDGTGHDLGVTVSAGGQTSDEERIAVAVVFAPPPTPTLTAEWDPDTASAVLTVTNPAGTPEVVSVELYADGVLVGTISPDSSMTDPIPNLAGTTYVARALSTTPTSADSDPVVLAPMPGRCGIHVNAGDRYTVHAALWGGAPSVDPSYDPDLYLDMYAGDDRPSPTWGPGRGFQLALSGTVWFDRPDSSREAWEAIVAAKSLVCYRDAARRKFGVLSDLSWSEQRINHARGFSAQFTETADDPGALTAPVGASIFDLIDGLA